MARIDLLRVDNGSILERLLAAIVAMRCIVKHGDVVDALPWSDRCLSQCTRENGDDSLRVFVPDEVKRRRRLSRRASATSAPGRL
jgi:hypothetical protein